MQNSFLKFFFQNNAATQQKIFLSQSIPLIHL